MWEGLATVTTSLAGFGLTWLVQSSALLALGLLAGGLLKRSGPAVQSAAYRTTLAAVLICPAASALLAGAGFDGFLLRLPSPPVASATERGSPATDPRQGNVPSETRTEVPSRDVVVTNPEAGAVSLDEVTVAPTSPIASSVGPEPVPGRPRAGFSRPEATAAVIILGLSAWLLGSAVMGLRLLVGQRRMGRLRASALPAEPAVEALCRDLAGRLGLRAPAVLRSPFLFSPCLDGLRRPAILLPDDVEDNLRETFVHELAHLARRDGLWTLLRRTAVAAFWVQPLLWALSRRLEVTAEEVCDDYVVQLGGDRARYAGHLLDLAGRALPPAAPAGVGMVSLRSLLARRIARILDPSRSLSTRAGSMAVLAMLTFGLAGTLLAGLLVVGAKREARAQAPAKAVEAKPDPGEETIRGQVVGPDGEPVAGATVIAWRSRMTPDGIGDPGDAPRKYEFSRKATDGDGRFALAVAGSKTDEPIDPSGPESGQSVSVIAMAPGFGLGYLLKDRPIRLTRGDLPVTGRLVDLEGRPAAGVKVRLLQLRVPGPDARRQVDGKGRPVKSTRSQDLGIDGEPILPSGVVTGADGRFRIDGLGRDTLASLELSGPDVALKRVQVVTRLMNRVAGPATDSRGVVEHGLYGADCTIPVEPTRPIEGIVRDARTDEPIPGAVVTAAALSGSTLMIDGLISTETDARGHYRLVGLPKEGAKGHELAVYPPLDRPYFITRHLEVPARPGIDPVTFDIPLRRAIWITGKVTDVATGKPVRAAVDYFPLLSNAKAEEYPNFNPNISASIQIKTRNQTDGEGKFRIAGLPGGGVVTAHTDDRSYRVGVGAESIQGRADHDQLLTYDRIYPKLYQGLKEVDVPGGVDTFACDLGLDPGGAVRLRLVDSTGAPVTGATIWGRYPGDADNGDRDLHDESVAKVGGLVPGEPRTVLIQHHDRKIGALLTIPADGPRDGPEITVTLRPTATLTGRLVDAKGNPARGGVRINLKRAGEEFFQYLPVATGELDADGRFRCELIPPGGPYRVEAVNRLIHSYGKPMEPDAFKDFVLAEGLQVEPDQAVDVGSFDVNSIKRVGDAPAAKAARPDVPITGRVVDLEGRPVAGVSVRVGGVRVPKGDDLTPWLDGVGRGEPPWVAYRHINSERKAPEAASREATTDVDGRFRLSGFGPDRVVELKLQGGTIAYAEIDVATRRMEPIAARGFRNQHGPGSLSIYGADFSFTAAPGRPVEGVVKDARTGQPLVGAEVRSYRLAGSDYVGTMTLRTKTDEKGRFRLSGMPKGQGNQLIVVPGEEQPYLLQEVDVPDPPGVGLVSVEVALPRGLWIEGTLTEQATGKPVPGAWLHYMPFLENTFAQAHPAFDEDGNSDNSDIQDHYKTRADGTFRLVGLPGRAIVGALVHDKAYLQGVGSDAIAGLNKSGHFETYRSPINPGRLWPTVMKKINPSADEELVRLDLQVTTGPSVRLSVVDADGKPVIGVSTRGLKGLSSYEREAMASSEGEVANLMPGEERTVLLRHEGRKIGKVVRVRQGDDANGPIVARLEPLAAMTGRVADVDGNPVPGATVRPDLLPSGDFSLSLPQVATDEQGRFLVPDVPVGCDYAMAVETLGAIRARQFTFLKRATVRPGETTDVGEIRFKSD